MKKLLSIMLGIALAITTFAWLDQPPTAQAALTFGISNVVGVPNSCGALVNPVVNYDISADVTAPDVFPVEFRVQRSSPFVTLPLGSLQSIPNNTPVGAANSNNGLFPAPANTPFTFTFIQEGTGITLASFTIDCTTGQEVAGGAGGGGLASLALTDPNGDVDGDTVRNAADNCIGVKNSDQANDWGTTAQGDACDTSFFDNGRGAKAFQRLSGNFNIFACPTGQCIFVGEIITRSLGNENTFQSSEARGWSIRVILVSDDGRERTYQVLLLNPDGSVFDDTFFIIIGPDYINWRGAFASGGLKLSDLVAAVTGPATSSNSSSARIPPGFEVYIPNARVNPPGFTANPNVRPGDQAIAIGTVIIRIAPDLRADPTGASVPYGAIVTVLEENGGGYWFYVVGEGFEGWVANEWFAPVP
jgi:hypothetical protein